jgi:hypothetical protein
MSGHREFAVTGFKTTWHAALLGVVMALGIQTYPASLVSLPLIVVVMAVLLLLFRAQRSLLRVPFIISALSCTAAGARFAVARVRSTSSARQ